MASTLRQRRVIYGVDSPPAESDLWRRVSAGGEFVYIKDDCGWWYYYAHLDRISPTLALGQRVTAGTYLGDLGNTGSAAGTRPHLHFSVYPDGDYNAGIDPYPMLRSVESTACTMSCLPICS